MTEGTPTVTTDADELTEEQEPVAVAKGEAEPHFTHPGLKWVDEAKCADLDLSRFFVEAGHVMPDEARTACMTCPVWEQCLTYSFLANPDGKMISGGYFASFSLGQRRKLTLGEAIELGRQAREEFRQQREGALL